MIARRLTSAVLVLIAAAVLAPLRATAAEPTIVQDPHYGEVLYYFYQEDYFPAIVRLLAARRTGQVPNHDSESELLLGGLYLSYGHHLRAADIFERLLADAVDPGIRDRTWFFLAKIWHQRGYLAESQNGLNNIEGELPHPLEAERHMLQAQIYIDAGEHDRAIALLQDWKGKTEWASYARFNLGVAMVRSGRVNAAADILEGLGSIDPLGNEELSSLRDKANLALGYAFLQDEQPLAAKPALQRVRLEGPFSNKALLGVGWADAQIENYDRALVPWMELRSRDLLDSAVQESMLAIPYAMAELESISQAADYYLNAVEAFYEETARIDRTIDHIESGGMFDEFLALDAESTTGWFWKLEELPDGPESRYLMHLLATHQFQEGLKNYRDLSYLERNLDRWQQSIAVYRNMLDTRRLAYEDRLPRVQQSLSDADLEGMVARKLEFDARVKTIEENRDILGLATDHEFQLWGEITALERNPALRADIPEAEEVRDKIRLLKGTLQWTLDKEFKQRLFNVTRNLRQAGEVLVETHRSRRQIDETMRTEPQMFSMMQARVDGLSPRIDALRSRVQVALAEQGGFMRDIAVEELQAQKKRLDTYTVQARFALAAIYDLSATSDETIVGDVGQ